MAKVTLLDLYGAQFKPGGRGAGIYDCQGLFLEVMRRYGHNVQDTDVAEHATEVVSGLIEGEIKSGKWERLEVPHEGCAVILALDPLAPRDSGHLGVYIGEQKFIQMLERRGVLMSRIDDRFFAGKIRGYYRWIG